MLCPRGSARFSAVCLGYGVAGLLILAWASPSKAQVIARPAIIVNGRPVGGGSATVALPEDRTIARKLKAAKDQIDAKDYGNAVSVLGKLLETSEDYFFKPDANAKSHYSLRKEIERLIGSLPEEGRRQYDLRFGPPGQKLLTEALTTGSWQTMEDVTRRYFHTEAGYQAAWLLGDYYLDQGQPLVAAKTFERLQQAPPKTVASLEPALSIKLAAAWMLAQREDRAKAVLEKLRRSHSGASLKFAEREIELFAPGGEPLARLRTHLPELFQRAANATEHLLARGDAARSGAGASHNPQVEFVWTADHYHGGAPDALSGGNPLFGNDNETDITKSIQGGVALLRQQNQPVLPAAQPIVVGDVVLLRTATQLVAIDCRPDRQGNRRWHVARDDRMLKLIDDAAREPAAATPPVIMGGRRRISPYNPGYNFAALRDQALQQRALYDATYGSLSSDGERVFCVEELNPVTVNYQAYLMGGMPMPQQASSGTYNRLRAYSIHKPEAKLMWELGGEKSSQSGAQSSPLAGAFFLGPPLPLSGRLYALAETNKQISLHTIEQHKGTYADGKLRITPQPLWSQPLCSVELGVEGDFTRRTAGLTPAHSDGILVCPTAAGAVVAVDLATRSLLWAYTYGRDEYVNSPYGAFPGAVVVGPGGASPYVGQGQGWADTGVIIAEGKVLATERGSRYLHCLNLEDGSPAWKEKIDRHDALFIGGVHDGHVLVVCPTYVRAHKMIDGAPAWPGSPRKEFPGGAKVAGRGFHHSGVYVLPLDNGRLATIEIKTGDMKITDDKVLPEGRVGLGNLVCVNGWLISQDLTGAHGFNQVSLETLSEAIKKNPSDVQALTQLGELLRQKGDLDGAIGHLRRAAQLSKTVVSRRLLARALVQALQADFAKYRALADELDPLTAAAEATDLRAQYLRLYSDGLFAAHEYKPAFDALLKLAQGDPRAVPLMPAGESLVLRNDRWLQSRWKKLLEGATPEVRGEVEKAIAARFAAAQQDAVPEALRLALSYFGNHPAAEGGRQQLSDMLLGQNDKQRLEVELLLRGLERSPDGQRSAAAVANLARFYRTAAEWPVQSHGFPAARLYYDRLKGELAAVAGPTGKTGKQLFDEAVAADEKFRDYLQPKAWPTGKITVKASAADTGADPFAPARRVPSGAGGQPDIDTTLLADPLASQYRYQVRGGYFTALNLGGKPLWRASLSDRKGDDDSRVASGFQSVAYGHRLAAHGHLLALVTGYEIIGIDASPGVDEGNRVLWRHSLTKLTETDSGAYLTPAPRIEPATWGQNVIRFYSPQGPLGSLEPVVSARQVSFLRGGELVTVDPLSGDMLWKRTGIEPGSDLLGDEEHLLVIGPEDTKATVYRALDGEQLGTRPVPHRTQRMAALGCRALCWAADDADGKVTLKMMDVLAEKTLWSSEYSATAKAALAGPDEIGVLDARGGVDRGRDPFQLVSLADGKVRFSSLVTGPAAESAAGIVLQRSADRYVLGVTTAAQGAARRVPARFAPTAYGNQGVAFIQGRVYVIDRRTGKLVRDWDAPGIGLPLFQPPESPVVAFVTTAYGTRTTGLARPTTAYQTIVQFLDKRTGQVVYRETFPPQMTGVADVSITVGPGYKVEFQHQSINLLLTFSDEGPSEQEQEQTKGLDLSLGLAGGATATPGVPVEVPIRRGIPVPLPVPVAPAPAPPLPR
jgi:outer membrane protein assembly factor BamB/tetratricopeptide (TPR) repeat protein